MSGGDCEGGVGGLRLFIRGLGGVDDCRGLDRATGMGGAARRPHAADPAARVDTANDPAREGGGEVACEVFSVTLGFPDGRWVGYDGAPPACLASPPARELRHRGDRIARLNDDLRHTVAAMIARDRLYVVWADAFPYEVLLPWEDVSRYAPLRIYQLGCATQTPHADAQLDAAGVADPLAALIDRDDVRLMAYPGLTPILARLYACRRGLIVAFEPEPIPASPELQFKMGVFRVTAARP